MTTGVDLIVPEYDWWHVHAGWANEAGPKVSHPPGSRFRAARSLSARRGTLPEMTTNSPPGPGRRPLKPRTLIMLIAGLVLMLCACIGAYRDSDDDSSPAGRPPAAGATTMVIVPAASPGFH